MVPRNRAAGCCEFGANTDPEGIPFMVLEVTAVVIDVDLVEVVAELVAREVVSVE